MFVRRSRPGLRTCGGTKQYIALVEQSAVVLGLTHFRKHLEGRRVVWFQDNSVVLSGLVKGSAREEYLDIGFSAIHLTLAAMHVRAWFEYIESNSNWSDGASRHLLDDPFARSAGFRLAEGQVPLWPWTLTGQQRLDEVLSMTGKKSSVGQEQRWRRAANPATTLSIVHSLLAGNTDRCRCLLVAY